MRRRDDPRTAHPGLVLPQAFERAVLQDPQQLDLKRQREIADLVEEQRPVRRGLAAADPVSHGARKRATNVAEHLRLEQFQRERTAVDGDERPPSSGRLIVDKPGHEFLAGPALARDQHGGFRVPEVLDQGEDPGHGWGPGDQAPERHGASQDVAGGQSLGPGPDYVDGGTSSVKSGNICARQTGQMPWVTFRSMVAPRYSSIAAHFPSCRIRLQPMQTGRTFDEARTLRQIFQDQRGVGDAARDKRGRGHQQEGLADLVAPAQFHPGALLHLGPAGERGVHGVPDHALVARRPAAAAVGRIAGVDAVQRLAATPVQDHVGAGSDQAGRALVHREDVDVVVDNEQRERQGLKRGPGDQRDVHRPTLRRSTAARSRSARHRPGPCR